MAKPAATPPVESVPAEFIRQNPADYGRRRVPYGGDPAPVPVAPQADAPAAPPIPKE